jgi:hypothetical protein
MGKNRGPIDLTQYSNIPFFHYSNLVDYGKSDDQIKNRWD